MSSTDPRCAEVPVTASDSIDLDARRATYLSWASGPGINLDIAYQVRVAAIGAPRSPLLDSRAYGESEDWCDGSPRFPILTAGTIVWPVRSQVAGCATTIVRQPLHPNQRMQAPTPRNLLALAVEGQQMDALGQTELSVTGDLPALQG